MNQKEQSAYQVRGRIAVPLLILFITAASACLMSAVLGVPQADVIRNTVLAAIGSGCFVFTMVQSHMEHQFLYDNEDHLWRFFFFYMVSLVMAYLFVFLPVAGWPYMVISITLALFGNEMLGVVSTGVLLMISTSLAGTHMEVFLLYFMTGIAAILFFRRIDSEFRVFLPFFCSFAVLFTAQTACIILYLNERLNVGMFVLPTIGLFINAILLVIVLKYFGYAVVNRYRMVYMTINDQEFELMARLRQEDKNAYYRAIHTGYLCERIAVRLGLNPAECKAGGYYHHLAACSVEEREEVFEMLTDEHHFPPAVLKLLDECNRPDHHFQTPEAAVVHMADAVVSSIMYLFSSNPDAKVSYEQVINSIFDRKIKTGLFDECSITFSQFQHMRKLFLEEKLYYDFLR
ncbi:MAG: hypothetical protein J6B10_06365 [Lachnospiraceae bacterium]|nr:hypothetical protein [Lachnospiraceae bacterium]